MLTFFGLAGLRPTWSQSVVAMGRFDGMHLGHQQLIRSAVERARTAECPCAVVTFDRHPSAILHPDKVPPAVATLEQNLRLFRRLGVSICVILPFERAMADTSAEAFAAMVLDDALRAKQVVIGHDFAFGRGRSGTPDWLRTRYETTVIEPHLVDGLRVSSTAVRQAVALGHMAQATKWLGRPFALAGVVVAGQKLGRTLGFPTANLALAVDQVLPGDGVYAGWASYDGVRVGAAISVGTRPTVDGTTRLVEAFLLEPPTEPLYSKAMELEFLVKVRDQETFSSLDALVMQMKVDVQEVKLNLESAQVGETCG